MPDRSAWPQLISTPSSYLMLIATLATMVVKHRLVAGVMDIDFVLGRWLAACSHDIAVFFGFALVFAVAEHYTRWARTVTIPLASIICTFALLNAGYLSISGEQLSSQLVSLGLDRFGDVQHILAATLLRRPISLVLYLLVLVALPLLVRRLLARRQVIEKPLARAHASLLWLVIAILMSVITPRPDDYGIRRLSENALVQTVVGTFAPGRASRRSGLFTGYRPHDLVDTAAIDKLKAGSRPNILILVLESTRRDETSLAGPHSRAATPNLLALSQQGIDLTSARAVVPHTTKSVWSMMCARIPLMQTAIYESSSTTDVQCLPAILNAAGWRSGFFQSAYGQFESRPRLVRRLGFQTFLAAEHISDKMLGYLASDDQTLLAPVSDWIAARPGTPFFATVLTSGTHHPYELPAERLAKAKAEGRATETERDMYDRAVEGEDELLAGILKMLEDRGLRENTIVFVLGDHGEGFGEHTIRQHASNFYEEGLHVPWIIVGPHIAHRVIDVDVSVMDLAPTLLDLLGVELTPEATASTPARSVFRPEAANRVLPFGCFYDASCYGFLANHVKVVRIPDPGDTFAFDLTKDPDERQPFAPDRDLSAKLEAVGELAASHRASRWLLRRDLVDWYPTWSCPENKPCVPLERKRDQPSH